MTAIKEKEWINFLENDHMIRESVWKEAGITFDAGYLYIPLKDPKSGTMVHKTRKSPTYTGGSKYVNPRGIPVMIYPDSNLPHEDWCVLTEGELDCLTCMSFDIPARTTTGGVNGFKEEFIPHFIKLKRAYIAYDVDDAGKEGSQRVAKILSILPNLEIYIVDLSTFEGVNDIGDFFKLGHSREEFIEACRTAKKYERKDGGGNSGTETPQGIKKQTLITETLTYLDVIEKVENLLPNGEEAFRIALAVAASSQFKNPLMLWVLLVGVPSSGKTEIVQLLRDSEFSYYLDNLTQNAFVSGERETRTQKVYDLLPLLDSKCLVIKDWTSIFSLDEKMTKKLLGDLVGIYDKEFRKFSSRRGHIGYESAFSQIGCITPATLNKHNQYMNMVGPRFLCYTMPTSTSTERENSFDMIFSGQDRAVIMNEARLYASSYLDQLAKKELCILPLSSAVKQYLRIAAELVSHCRGVVITEQTSFMNDEKETVKYYEVQDMQIEEPWRALQQLISLCHYLAFVVDSDEVGPTELKTIKNIVLSTMPANRAQALQSVANSRGFITKGALSSISGKSVKTSGRLLKELTALLVLEKTKDLDEMEGDYAVTEQFREFITLDPAEFLSNHLQGKNTEETGK